MREMREAVGRGRSKAVALVAVKCWEEGWWAVWAAAGGLAGWGMCEPRTEATVEAAVTEEEVEEALWMRHTQPRELPNVSRKSGVMMRNTAGKRWADECEWRQM